MSATKEILHDEIETGMKNTPAWQQSTHLLDPVAGNKMKPLFAISRCGKVMKPGTIKTTTYTNDVTCKKCLGYINNPYRALRKYGKVKVLENHFIMLWGGYGHELDIVVYVEKPTDWKIVIARKGEPYMMLTITAFNMADLGFKVLGVLEKEMSASAKS